MAKVQAINGGDVQVKAKSRAKRGLKAPPKEGVQVLKPSLNRRGANVKTLHPLKEELAMFGGRPI